VKHPVLLGVIDAGIPIANSGFMNTAGEELLRQIFSTGICILVNDQKVLSRFKTAAFSRIAAFSMYQTQIHKGFISSLKKEAGIG